MTYIEPTWYFNYFEKVPQGKDEKTMKEMIVIDSRNPKYDRIYVGATGKTETEKIKEYIRSKLRDPHEEFLPFVSCDVIITKERNLFPLEEKEKEIIDIAKEHWGDRCTNNPDMAGVGLETDTGACYEICWKYDQRKRKLKDGESGFLNPKKRKI